jgi:hypothetical protein
MHDHGTTTGYRRGCRCADCKAANAAAGREYRTRKGAAVNARTRARRAADPERYRAVERAWRAANIDAVREQHRAEYYRHHDERRSYLRQRSALRGQRWAVAKVELVGHLGGACVDCGNTDPRCLQFDHVNIADKVDTVPNLVRSRGIDSPLVWAEVAKCVLRCGNCHAVKTFAEGDYLAGKARQHGHAPLTLSSAAWTSFT